MKDLKNTLLVLLSRKVIDVALPILISSLNDVSYTGEYYKLVSLYLLLDAFINFKVRLPLLNGLSRTKKPNIGSLICTSLIVEYFSSILLYASLFLTLVSFSHWFDFSASLEIVLLFIFLAHVNFLGTGQALLQWRNKNYIIEISETLISFTMPIAILLSSSPMKLFLSYLGISGMIRFAMFLFAINSIGIKSNEWSFSFKLKELEGLWKLHWTTTIRGITEYGEGTLIPIILGPNVYGGFKIIRSALAPFLSLAQPIQSVYYSKLVKLSSNLEFARIKQYENLSLYTSIGYLIYWIFLCAYSTDILEYLNIVISYDSSLKALLYYLPVGFYILGFYFLPVLNGLRQESYILRVTIVMTITYIIIVVFSMTLTSLIIANFAQFTLQYLAFKNKFNEKKNSWYNKVSG